MDYLEKLTKLRKEKGLSIGKLTTLAGLSENTIYLPSQIPRAKMPIKKSAPNGKRR